MRKIYLFMMVSLDGFFEGPNHELDWHNTDKEFDDFAIGQLNQTGTILFGRVTYDMMYKFWPSDFARRTDPVVAEKMNSLPKVVFSRTLDKAEWNNTIASRNIKEELTRLKNQSGKDIAVFGSSDLAVSIIHEGFLDELRIMVNPVILGKGKRLFEGLDSRLNLKLMNSRSFHSGNELLNYQILKKE